MKKTVLLFVAFSLFIACKKEETKSDANLHITGNVKGIKQGKLYIQMLQDSTLVVMDSIIFDGKSTFESHLKIDSPEMLYLFLDRGQTNSLDNNLVVFAEHGDLSIETSLETFYGNAQIKGSKNHELFQDFLKINSRFNNEQLLLLEKEIKAKQENNQASLDSIQVENEKLIKRKYLYSINFALNQKEYEVSPYIALSEIHDAQLKYLDTIHNSMSPKVAKSKYGKMLTKYIDERRKEEN
ncbi:DUF4369 domain-containing protein [Flavobacterium piscinae]|uniref:DUF4369 domain-containing protein n=2 Tax=Flavobacterium piscinae TaxID=2506424 RepID=A0A4V1N4Q6_9FLAO|nr:DUF4369 domain-containing protein [Flavobacterium piscinae]RXR32996.1 DUF4369 domain-containing protein [Flavobacterium piscinae]